MSSPMRSALSIMRSRGSFRYAPYSRLRSDAKFLASEDVMLYQSWIFNYFRSNDLYATYFKTSHLVDPSFRVLTSDVKTLSHAQLLDYACAIGTRKGKKSLISDLDEELSLRLNVIESVDLILKLLDLFIQVRPSGLQMTPLFNQSISRIETLALTKRVSTHHLIQSMYYASLGKSRRSSQRVIRTLYRLVNRDDIKTFPIDAIGIFCNALFRSSVPVQDQDVLEMIVDKIASSDSCCVRDSTLISIIKVLRHATYNNVELYRRFEVSMSKPSFPWESKPLAYKVHLLAYFADGLYANVDFMDLFIKQTIADFDDRIRNNQRVRLKDLDRLLWSASNYMLDSVKQRLTDSEIPRFLTNLSDSAIDNELSMCCNIVFWLWVCGYQHYVGVQRVMRNPKIFKIKAEGGFKEASKLLTFMTVVDIEAPRLLPPDLFNKRDNRLQPRHGHYMSKMPYLQQTLRFLEAHGHKYGLEDPVFQFQIPTFYTAGIVVKFKGEPVNIEVADSYFCLRNSSILNNKLALKLRLLKALGEPFYLIKPLENDDPCVLYSEYLESHLKAWFAE